MTLFPLFRYLAMLPGLLFCGLIALSAFYLGQFAPLQNAGLSALTIAIILGMLIGNTWYKNVELHLASGVGLSKQRLLRLGIILYGFRLTLQDVASVGVEGILSDALVVCSTFLLALFIGIKLFRLNRESVILIGAGSSICGAAAVMAADGVVEAKSEDVSVAISTVVVFGSIAMFLYPYLYQLNLTANWISTDATTFGIYAGSTIHEVAQVVAAGLSIDPQVGDVAVITKMVRVMMLAPFLLLLPLLCASTSKKTSIPIHVKDAQRLTSLLFPACGREGDHGTSMHSIRNFAKTVPWFAFLFIAMTVLNSLQIFPAQWVKVVVEIDTILLSMAMAALGLTTHFSVVRKAGIRPLLLGLILFGWLIVGGALINRMVFGF